MADQSAPDQSVTFIRHQNNPWLIITAVVVILVILAGAGYFVQRKSQETTNGKKAQMENGGEDQKATIETENGQVVIKEGELTEKFPTDVAQYKGAQVVKSTEAADGISAIFKTGDSIKKAADFYKKDLAKEGWKNISTKTGGGSTLITAEKDKRKLILTVVTDEKDKKTTISIVVTSSA